MTPFLKSAFLLPVLELHVQSKQILIDVAKFLFSEKVSV